MSFNSQLQKFSVVHSDRVNHVYLNPNVKGSVGLILVKTSVMRIYLPFDTVRPDLPHPGGTRIESQDTSMLL